MSIVGIEENLYSAKQALGGDNPLGFGLELDIRTPALTPDSSFTFGQQQQQQQQQKQHFSPSTPQGSVPDSNTFWYSPTKPLFISTSTPTSDYNDYRPNVCARFPPRGVSSNVWRNTNKVVSSSYWTNSPLDILIKSQGSS